MFYKFNLSDMAKVVYGPMVSALVGSIGGITFQRNLSGEIARLRPIQRKFPNPNQTDKISAFQVIMGLWHSLTVSQRLAWNTFASAYTFTDSWGTTKNISGYNWFLSVNSNLVLIGESPITSPPTWHTPTAVPSFDVYFLYNNLYVTWLPEFSHPNDKCLVFTSPVTRFTSEYNRSLLRYTNTIPVGSSSAWNFDTAWQSVHGVDLPVSGGSTSLAVLVAICTIRYNTGLASVFTTGVGQYVPPSSP